MIEPLLSWCSDCGVKAVAGRSPRCRECRRLRRVDSVRRSQGKTDALLLVGATRRFSPWTSEEDAMLAIEGLSIAQTAKALGRTRAAIYNRKKTLAQPGPKGNTNGSRT